MRRTMAGLLVGLCLLGTGLTGGGTAVAADIGDRLYPGETMFPGESLRSANGAYQLLMQADGNAVIYDLSGTPLWASRSKSPDSDFALRYDGNAAVQSQDGGTTSWESGTAGRYAQHIVMQDDGNLVIYSVEGDPTWSSRASIGAIWLGTTLKPGQKLSAGQNLAVGMYRLAMQPDGNLVLRRNGVAVWHTRTQGHPGAYLLMQPDGNAVIYSVDRKALWYTRTAGRPNSTMRLQADGNLVLYQADGRPSWSRLKGRV